MNQSKIESALESVLGTTIGFIFGVLAQVIIFPLYGVEFTLVQNIEICTGFTVISLLRGYAVRRWCNKYLNKAVKMFAYTIGEMYNAFR